MSGVSPEPSRSLRLLRAAAHGLVAGAVAGATVGAIEAALAWSHASHFLFTGAAKIRFIAFTAALYGSAAAVTGTAAGFCAAALWQHTAPGRWLAGALRRHEQARRSDPRDALTWLALAVAGVPLVCACLAAAYAGAYELLAPRRHPGLVIAAAMAASLGAVAAAAIATAVAVRPVELVLRALARRPALGRALSAPLAPGIAAAALFAAAAAVAAFFTWDTLSLLSIAPGVVALAIAALTAVAARMCLRFTDRLLARPRLPRRIAIAAIPVGLALLTVAAGAPPATRKTANQYTALGSPLLRAYRGAFALAGQGDASGDCDPFIPARGDQPPCPGAEQLAHLLDTGTDFVDLPAEIPERPNIVLITIDTLRHDHVGAYGYERDTTPNMDRLAGEGALFENSWAHAPSTRYSMPAILTGRYPLGVDYDHSLRGWPGLSEDNTTIAEIAKAAGYRTAGFTNHWYFDRRRRMDQGFDVYDNANARLHKTVPGAGPAESTGSSSRQQTDRALRFLDEHLGRTEREPFLLWAHYYDPHYVYSKHPETGDFGDSRQDLYDSEIAFTDHHIGRLLDRIHDEGLWDETAVVITSDHGEGFGEKGIDLHGYHLYAPQTRVPLIIRIPGAEGRRVAMPVGHVDILPTIANLVGGEPGPDMVGRSLLGAITGQRPAAAAGDVDRWVFQQLSFENNNEIRGAANGQCHVIYNISPHASWELYRIDRDPAEERDVIGKPGPCAGGPELLAAWTRYSQVPADADEALVNARPDVADPLDVDFGPQARLLAVDVPEEPVRRGDSFEVTYTFEAGGALDDAWKIFVHVASDEGGFFQGDHEPARPFPWWRAGDIIQYTRSIRVPRDARAGEYAVWMGLFRGNERRPATSDRVEIEDDRARVGRVTIR